MCNAISVIYERQCKNNNVWGFTPSYCYECASHIWHWFPCYLFDTSTVLFTKVMTIFCIVIDQVVFNMKYLGHWFWILMLLQKYRARRLEIKTTAFWSHDFPCSVLPKVLSIGFCLWNMVRVQVSSLTQVSHNIKWHLLVRKYLLAFLNWCWARLKLI